MTIDFETPLQDLNLFISYRHGDGSEAAQEVDNALDVTARVFGSM